MNLKSYYRAPVPAILALTVVVFWQGFAHTLMIMLERVFGEDHVYECATILGVVGAVMIWAGRHKAELPATIYGFLGGSLVWTTWIEFSFHYYARHVGVAALDTAGHITKPEYLVMPSSLGVLGACMIYFLFNKDSKCNAFRWLHRNLRMDLGEPASGKGRNIASIVALEAVVVTWFFYLMLLALYDEQIIGAQHPVTYAVCFLALVWSAYLAQRLFRFEQMGPALRYAIPTGIIFWNVVEILGRWGILTEVWIHPEKYVVEVLIILGALVTAVVLAAVSPARRAVVYD